LEFLSTRRTSLLKNIVLTGFCGLFIAFAIQIDFPTLQDLSDRVQTAFVERQLEIGNSSQEELVREGWLYYNLGEYETAREVMERAAAGETNISASYCLGLIHLKYRQFENAIAKFKNVAAQSPNHAATRIGLGQAYYELQYWGLAAKELEHAVQLEPTNEMARLWLGKTYLNLNQSEKAGSILATVTNGRESLEAAVLLKSIAEKEALSSYK
jgi:tetratricopeptide (TPR) repeat protein